MMGYGRCSRPDCRAVLTQIVAPYFRDLLRKKRRPVSLHEGLRESLRMIPANEQPKATVHRLRRRG